MFYINLKTYLYIYEKDKGFVYSYEKKVYLADNIIEIENFINANNLNRTKVMLWSARVDDNLVNMDFLNKRYKSKYVSTEIIRRKKDNNIVDYRYVNNNIILFSSILKDKIDEYLSYLPNIYSMSSRLDLILNLYLDLEARSQALIIIDEDSIDVCISEADNIKLLDINRSNDDIDLVTYNIENIIGESEDILCINISGEDLRFSNDLKIKEYSIEDIFKNIYK